MSVPALRIPIRADVSQFQNDMKNTSSIAGTAVRSITKQVIDLNAGFLATKGAAGGATLAFRGVLGVLGPIALGITAVSQAFKLMSYATDLAKAKIEEFNDIAKQAGGSGVSTDFFQRFTKSGAAVLSLDEVTAALKRFNEATTDKLGGSDLSQRVGTLVDAGNFGGNSGVAALSGSTTTEDKLRAVVKLIDEAMEKGQRLAALDIAGKAFGAPVAAALQADNGYLDQMLKRADAMSNAKIISPEDVGRAIELKERMDAAQKVLAEKWKPVQDDLAKLGMNYHESWVNITEDLAAAVGYATQLYTALNQVPDWFAKRIGGASIWSAITNATTTPEGRAASEAAGGISSDPADIARVGQNAKLAAALQNHANVTRGMRAATDIQSAVRGDTSKAPGGAGGDVNDAVDRAINTLARHTEATLADAKAVGLGDAALAKFRAEAAETAAVQANGGKETAEQAAQFKVLQDKAAAAAEALAKARVANDISVGRQTAFLTAEDVAIARELAGIYGTDIPKALASAEAAELRFNQQLKAMSDLGQDVNRSLFVDFETGLRNGKSAWESFQAAGVNALGKIADKLASMAADNLWKAAFGGTSGGIFAGLFGGDVSGGSSSNPLPGLTAADYGPGFAGGGYTGAGGRLEPAGIVHRGEYVMDAATTSRIGVGRLNALRGYAQGGVVTAPDSGGQGGIMVKGGDVHITVQGNADEKTLAIMKRELNARDAAFVSNVKESVIKLRQWRHI
jgi:hypothetical protein